MVFTWAEAFSAPLAEGNWSGFADDCDSVASELCNLKRIDGYVGVIEKKSVQDLTFVQPIVQQQIPSNLGVI